MKNLLASFICICSGLLFAVPPTPTDYECLLESEETMVTVRVYTGCFGPTGYLAAIGGDELQSCHVEGYKNSGTVLLTCGLEMITLDRFELKGTISLAGGPVKNMSCTIKE